MTNTTLLSAADRNPDTSTYWADLMDIGVFLFDHAVSVTVPGNEVDYPSDEVDFYLGLTFVDLVFNGHLEAAYEYAYNLKPFDYKS